MPTPSMSELKREDVLLTEVEMRTATHITHIAIGTPSNYHVAALAQARKLVQWLEGPCEHYPPERHYSVTERLHCPKCWAELRHVLGMAKEGE